jgi:hypothetical protein
MEPNKISEDYSFLEKVNMESGELVECLVIKQGIIKDISWKDPNYINKIVELDYIESVIVNSENFLDILAKNLDVNKFTVSNMSAKTEIVGEEPYYLYELTYIDLEKEKKYHNDENINDIANLITINGDKLYSNAILYRNHIPSLSDSMNLCNVNKEDLKRLLYKRAYNTIVIGDSFENKYIEYNVIGEMDVYAKKYFEGEEYKKKELAFLMHNINIWYSIGITENNICGNLINEKYIDKCIWFTMSSDTYRGNLTLDEVTKIIYLSLRLEDYKTPSELMEERNDDLGRKIIYNKYKVLDKLYNDNKNLL